MDAAAFAAKYLSKREVYRFLTHDCGCYLPNYESVTIFHMRDIAAGKRTKVKTEKIQHIQVPYFEDLKVELMLEYAADKPDVMNALPILQREREKLPRQYIANVIYTFQKEHFKNWVDERVNRRHEMRRQQEDTIMMDPEIAQVFNASMATSGKFHILLIFEVFLMCLKRKMNP